MHSYHTLVLFPKIDDYSSIHEWPFINTLQNYSDYTLQAYLTASDLAEMIHKYANDDLTRTIVIFGTNAEWSLLQNVLTQHPNCMFHTAPAPYSIYARINGYTHLVGLTTTTNSLAIAQRHLIGYYHALDPRTLYALSDRLGHVLRKTGLTISCAESCTGGLISKALTDVAGASSYFNGGTCTYTAEIKSTVLGVPQTTISEKGVVSEETVEAMALGAQHLFESDIALSTTGVAGPGADSDGNPEGLVYCCIAINSDHYIERYLASDETIYTDRDFIRADCVRFILEKLLSHFFAH